MDLDDACKRHTEWKYRLHLAIERKGSMDASVLSKDDCCDLGKWLHGEGTTKFGFFLEMKDCIEKHAIFHKEAGKVAIIINAKAYDNAAAMLGMDRSYVIALKNMEVAIIRLKKKASL